MTDNEITDAQVGAAMNAVVTYYEAQGHTMRPESLDYQALRAALAAFEKAHTSTDEEREADQILRDAGISRESAHVSGTRQLILTALRRRTEVPEPSAGPRHFAPYGSTNALCDETVPRQVAWDETTGEYADQRFTVKRDRTSCPECRWRMGLGPEPQGEPSDAQVLAYIRASSHLPTAGLSDWSDRFVADVRAGLRAAGGVR